MDLSGDFTFDAPQELTWKALQDPNVLAFVMPGGEDFKQTGENEYSGVLNIKVGPVQGKYTGTIRLSDIVASEGYSIQVDGRGSQGFVKANGRLKLTGQESKTCMTYEGNAQVGGRIASVGQRLIETSARSIIRQSLEGLNEYLKVQLAASSPAEIVRDSANEIATGSAGMAAPRYVPPSQAIVALNVVKDIYRDIVPPQARPVAIAAIAFMFILIIFRRSRNKSR